MNYRYAYQRDGAPLLDWKHGPPRQTRAADSVGLGSLDRPTITLPAPGAPEPINSLGDCGCGCKGAGTCGKAMSDITDTVMGLSLPVKLGLAAAVYFAYKKLKKRR